MIMHVRNARRVVAGFAVVPGLPQPRERERLTVAATDEPRLLRGFGFPALDLLPLVEAVGRDDAPPPLERRA